MTRIIGYLIYFIGYILYREHIRFLGHFLTKRGTDLSFREKYVPEIKKILKEILSSGNHIAIDNNLLIAAYYADEEDKMSKDIYRCLGKFFIEKSSNKINIFDYYEFYPWCGDSQHFNHCDCEYKCWGIEGFEFVARFIKNIYFCVYISIEDDELEFHTVFEYKSKRIINRIFHKRINNIKSRVELLSFQITYGGYAVFNFNDYIFSKIGKPFYIYQEII